MLDFLWKCIEDVEFCLEVIDWYVDNEERDCNYVLIFFESSFVSFLFFFFGVY